MDGAASRIQIWLPSGKHEAKSHLTFTQRETRSLIKWCYYLFFLKQVLAFLLLFSYVFKSLNADIWDLLTLDSPSYVQLSILKWKKENL